MHTGIFMDEVYSGMSLTYFSFDLFVKILVLAYIDDHGKIKTSVEKNAR